MNYKCFTLETSNQIAHIRLNRPEKRNSMIPEFWDELPALVEDLDRNARARVIVISSTGPHFSAGLDLNSFFTGERPQLTEEEEQLARRRKGVASYHNIQRMQRTFSCLEECRLPVLACIQGGAIGGGVDLITACDMRYMTEDAFLTIFEINIGMTADVGTFPRLVKLIPEGVVRELAYTGRRMPAAEAQAVGLVNRVFPNQEAMLAGVMELAGEIAARAPIAVYGSKRIINYARDHSTADGLDYISLWNAANLLPDEMAEAMQARAERRSGRFADLPPVRTATSTDPTS